MKYIFSFLVGFNIFLFCYKVSAYTDNHFHVGLAYFSENILGKTTQSDSGSTSTLGSPSYPLLLKYDLNLLPNQFISPSLTYTLINRKDPGDSAKVTVWHLFVPYGRNFAGNWDWSAGLGVLNRTIEGPGGTQQLPNGTGTATFALPGGKSTAQNYTFSLGSSYTFYKNRLGLDLITESIFSSKRNYNLMFSYSYAISFSSRSSASTSRTSGALR